MRNSSIRSTALLQSAFVLTFVLSAPAWAAPGGNGGGHNGGNGGKTGNGQDTPADVYLYHVAPYGILGDEWLVDGDATVYPHNSADNNSCASAIVTDQASGYVRMFVPGDWDNCADGPNRFLKMRSPYDLDQDGLCEIPYTGRSDSGSYSRFYDCSAGPEPDGLEEVYVTVHLDGVLGPSGYTSVGFQIRLLDYGDSYVPTAGYDPVPDDIAIIGSQERAFNISLTDPATSTPDAADAEIRVFENLVGTANICQVVWKNAHAHDCYQIIDESTGNPVVLTGMAIKGKVDPTPMP